MIILDKPYVSDFLKETIRRFNIPVLKTKNINNYNLDAQTILWDENVAIQHYKDNPDSPLYTPSENSLQWISDHLGFTPLPHMINVFKDKVRFRERLKTMYPDFYFREIDFRGLDNLNIKDMPKPFIIKPSIGFFSMGVYRVDDNKDWPHIRQQIKQEMASIHNLYPVAVLDATRFIIEEFISGTEFAFDAYFNQHGEPVLLNTFEHFFASDQDVSDRVYVTSASLLQKYVMPFTQFLQQLGALIPLKNFPMHVEVRVDDNGIIRPIEINPMRFGGWCTTADMTFHAYGFNPYDYFFNQKKPHWDELLQHKTSLYSLIVLDNSTGVNGDEIHSFDYDKLLTHFDKPLELRKINFTEYPVFGFLFAETAIDNLAELEYILKSDLSEFIEII
jgi:hypothetical protein